MDETPQGHGFSPLVAACFTLNYIMGTGFLTLPWAFVQAGLALSTVLMIVCLVFADIAKDMLLEVMAYAESLNHPPLENNSESESNIVMDGDNLNTVESQGEEKNGYYDTREECLNGSLSDLSSSSLLQKNSEERNEGFHEIKETKYEMGELCRMFLNTSGYVSFAALYSIWTFLVLWVYSTVFCTALSQYIPITSNINTDYYIYAAIFSAIVLPLSTMELTEQIFYQVFLSGCRVVMLLLMVFTAFATKDDLPDKDANYQPGFSGAVGAPMIRASGIYNALPIILFSVVFHANIPGLSHPVYKKRKLGHIFRSTLVIIGLAYCFIAITVGWYFGEDVQKSSNLNWENYHGGTGEKAEDGSWVNVAVWAKVISTYVVCFPALDVLSAFPLNAVTFGNLIMVVIAGESIHDVEENRTTKTLCRLTAAIPPLIGSVLVKDIALITEYAGLLTYTLFCFIAIIHVASRRRLHREGIAADTHYGTFGTNKPLAYIIFWLAVAMIVLNAVYLIFMNR